MPNIVEKKPNMVFLSGWGCDSGIWRDFSTFFDTRFNVRCMNLPGYGDAFCQSASTFDDIVASIASQLATQTIVIGWSLGGLVAIALACRYPEKMLQLVTLACNPCFIEDSEWPGMSFDMFQQFMRRCQSNSIAALHYFLVLIFYGHENQRQLYKKILAMLDKQHPTSTSLIMGLQYLKTVDLRNDIATVTCPFLQIFGGNDALVPANVATAIQHYVPLANIQIMDAATHAPFICHPLQCAHLIENFYDASSH